MKMTWSIQIGTIKEFYSGIFLKIEPNYQIFNDIRHIYAINVT